MLDLVICDLAAPEQIGFDVIHAVHFPAPSVPIIAVSGENDWDLNDIFNVACALGASTGLAKPIAPENLLGAVEHLLGPRSGVPGRDGGRAPLA